MDRKAIGDKILKVYKEKTGCDAPHDRKSLKHFLEFLLEAGKDLNPIERIDLAQQADWAIYFSQIEGKSTDSDIREVLLYVELCAEDYCNEDFTAEMSDSKRRGLEFYTSKL